ncbi:MAG: M48 family metalloprotease, partial [Candidatus Kariarchaeaceae archaeon]
MPANLYIRSTAILFTLWGLVFALVSLFFYTYQDIAIIAGSPLIAAMMIAFIFVFLQFLISPYLMDWILGWVYRLSWVDINQLPEDMAQALIEAMNKHDFTISKLGIIHDQMPNAFTYGHFKKNARIVVTEGIIDLLDPDERVAVLEHEIGHIVHHDFIFMTLAQAVPLMFYLIYITSRSFSRTLGRASGGKTEGSAKSAAAGVMLVSYIFYIISGFIVLLLSRTRESYADHFAAVETGRPNSMSTALVKVGYGLVTADADSKARANDKEAPNNQRRQAMRQNGIMYGMRSMGLADVNTAKGLVMQAYVEKKEELHPDAIAAAAAWDLNSPWAKFIELNSTHPLIGKRLRYLD